MGDIMQSLDDEEGILIQEINKQEIDFARNLLQFLRDRLPDTYGLLLEQEAMRRKETFTFLVAVRF
ncbi:hypothetical protein [Aneurinibacillus danicus]|nr:hypothetical protein [Aneurinibacillus danicus]